VACQRESLAFFASFPAPQAPPHTKLMPSELLQLDLNPLEVGQSDNHHLKMALRFGDLLFTTHRRSVIFTGENQLALDENAHRRADREFSKFSR